MLGLAVLLDFFCCLLGLWFFDLEIFDGFGVSLRAQVFHWVYFGFQWNFFELAVPAVTGLFYLFQIEQTPDCSNIYNHYQTSPMEQKHCALKVWMSL